MLQLVQDYVTSHQEEICIAASRDTGKTRMFRVSVMADSA